MTKGLVFNIQHFCLDDGPGIRTTVFLKGCPLHCHWCHNPESHRANSEIFYDAALCIGCGACVTVCPNGARQMCVYNRSRCTACGACEDVCPAAALERAGRKVTAKEVMEEVLRDRAFYETSSGGLTLSGGEPLLQGAFSMALLTEAKRATLHTCVETCGYASAETVCKLAEVTDLFLYDWKLTDPVLHKYHTGVGNEQIRKNLHMLDSMGKTIVLRCPLIPDVNDTEEHFMGIAEIANTCRNILHIELEPYHALGMEKSKRLGKTTRSFRTPSTEEVSQWKEKIAVYTKKEIKIG